MYIYKLENVLHKVRLYNTIILFRREGTIQNISKSNILQSLSVEI